MLKCFIKNKSQIRNGSRKRGKKRLLSAKGIVTFGLLMVMMLAMSVVAFASTPEVAITADMLEPVLAGVAANVGVIVPVAIGLFVLILGLRFIPKLFKMFSQG